MRYARVPSSLTTDRRSGRTRALTRSCLLGRAWALGATRSACRRDASEKTYVWLRSCRTRASPTNSLPCSCSALRGSSTGTTTGSNQTWKSKSPTRWSTVERQRAKGVRKNTGSLISTTASSITKTSTRSKRAARTLLRRGHACQMTYSVPGTRQLSTLMPRDSGTRSARALGPKRKGACR